MSTAETEQTRTTAGVGERAGQDPPKDAQPARPVPAARSDGTTFETLAVCGFIFGMFAIVAAVFAVGLATRAVDEAKDSRSGTANVAAPSGGVSTLDVSLKEFAIGPADLRVAAGATIAIQNNGTVVHNLSVDGRASEMLGAGQSGQLDLRGLAPGSYTMRCDVPGHAAAGMTGTVVIE